MDGNEDLKFLHEAIFGETLEEIRDPDEILALLDEGEGDLILDLKWGESRNDEYHERHKIVLQKLDEDDRVVFYNPMGHPATMKPGEIIEGKDRGPVRKIEGTGVESVSLDDFYTFFEDRDAVCFIPGDL